MESTRDKVTALLRRNIAGAEIGRRLGISRQRVSQIARELGIERVWAPVGKRGLPAGPRGRKD